MLGQSTVSSKYAKLDLNIPNSKVKIQSQILMSRIILLYAYKVVGLQ